MLQEMGELYFRSLYETGGWERAIGQRFRSIVAYLSLNTYVISETVRQKQTEPGQLKT